MNVQSRVEPEEVYVNCADIDHAQHDAPQIAQALWAKLQGTGWTKAEIKALAWHLTSLAGPYGVDRVTNGRANVLLRVRGPLAGHSIIWQLHPTWVSDNCDNFNKLYPNAVLKSGQIA